MDVGSYSLFSKPDGDVVIMPYSPQRFGQTRCEFGGKRTTLSWRNDSLRAQTDTAIARFPADIAALPASYGGPTVLATGRRGSDIYLADGASLDFKKIDIVAHHNACLPEAMLDTIVWEEFPWFYPNTGHTDVLQIGPNRLLFAYDRIPDGWRYNDTFTGPDEIYMVIVDIE